jgi:hypothetical protein
MPDAIISLGTAQYARTGIWGLGVMERQAKESIVLEKIMAGWASICKLELVEYFLYTHGRVPANDAGVR